jgi:hypothetical protein
MRKGWTAAAGAAGAVALAAGCFNGALHDYSTVGGDRRLELVVESDRTDVDATHFLLDSATGDLWRLEVDAGTAARWVRLAAGPEDLRELAPDAESPEGPEG